MVGLVDYGSGSESDSETPVVSLPKKHGPTPPVASSSQLKPPPKKKKIGIALPALSNKPKHDEGQEEDSIDDRPTKKARTNGSGKSSLLGMLPAPKTNTPVAAPKQRVLGGGGGPGLVFNSSSRNAENSTSAHDEPTLPSNPYASIEPEPDEGEAPESSTTIPAAKPFLLPPSLQKKRANVSLEETSTNTPKSIPSKPTAPAVDFFGLSSAVSSTLQIPSSSSSTLIAPSLSAAPVVPEEKIPEPTPYDPYPGYYQKPNGEWAQYDVEYYTKFQKKWQAEYDAHVRALEKGAVKGFEDYDAASAQEIDPVEEMERAKKEVQEREERKSDATAETGEKRKRGVEPDGGLYAGTEGYQRATLVGEE
ncbi:hypothetical protein NMY22_g227 [Coprinellus aureogranulatus]|nr:hypothetical protein NMY22_g227 [Coprinellus aureogranulatus]